MLKHFVGGAAFVMIASAGAVTAASQDARGQEPRPPRTAAPGPLQRDRQMQARYNIFVMEGVLERAVAHGAERVWRQVRRVMPDMLMVTGDAQARGFRLDGYGVFFDVSVPGVRQSVAWSLRTMVQDNNVAAASLQQLKAAIERMTPDARERATLMQAIKRLEVQVGAPLQGSPSQTVAAAPPSADRATVTALDAAPAAPEAERTLSPEDKAVLDDPNGAYEREVIDALIDAMLNHSAPIGIGPDEWLTVAAHDNEHRNRLVPGDPYDLLTIVLRVKGSDLAAFRADRLSLEDARKRVEVREF